MNRNSRDPQTKRPSGSQTSKASKLTERRDAIRILVALVFIAMASVASLDHSAPIEVRNPQSLSESKSTKDSKGNPAGISWARLLLEALHRIV